MSAFLSVDLLIEFAAFCLTDFIDWRYIHSWFVFLTQLVNCYPHGRRNYTLLVYCCPSTVLREEVFMEGPLEPNMGPSLADVLLCTFESTNAGFSSFPLRKLLSWE
jgi:hypothetical protein